MVMERRRPEIIFSTLTGIVMLIFMLASLTDRDFFQFEIDLFGLSLGMGVSSMELLIPFSAEKGTGRDELVRHILSACERTAP